MPVTILFIDNNEAVFELVRHLLLGANTDQIQIIISAESFEA